VQVITALHNLQFNASQFLDPGNELALVATVSPDFLQQRLLKLDTFQE
jgi:hypothetical protein